MSGIKVIFGTAGVNPGRAFGSPEALQDVFAVLEKKNVKNIDTAALYGDSEKILGQASAGKRFSLDTKLRGGFGSGSTKELIQKEAKESKELLGVDVDILYLHAPDYNTPLEETLAAVDTVHKSGFFKRFGLSNYQAKDVEAVYNHAKEKGYVLPTVYQGNYSAVARKQEDLLFPLLRKLGIAFYAYSPLAGGFLTKSKEMILEGAGRFKPEGSMYSTMYAKPSYLEALAQWEAIAKAEGCSRADLAYRWVRYNSPLKVEQGDAIIIGASSLEQLKETLDSINGGPLSKDAVEKIDKVWETIKDEAPLDNFHK